MILPAIALGAKQSPHQVALKGQISSFTYANLQLEITSLSEKLQKLSPKVLGIFMENSPSWAIVDLAAMQLGIPNVPIPMFFSPEQIAHTIEDAGMDTIVSSQALKLSQILSSSHIHIEAEHHFLAGDKVVTVFSIRPKKTVELPKNTSKITYTSGTTGKPKGVCLSLKAIETVTQSLLNATQAHAQDKHLNIVPLSTLLENIAGLYVPLLAGASVVMLPPDQVGIANSSGFDIQKFMQAIYQHQASSLILMPELLYALVSALEAGMPRPEHLRFIAVGGASVSPQLLERAETLGLPVYEGYGLSECCSVVTLNTPIHKKLGSVGKTLAHTEVSIADDGEIFVKGTNFLAYIGENSQQSSKVATGDIGYLDDEGFLYLSGRKKNMFITSFGRNVSPEWVERELTTSLLIQQAALFGEAKPWNTAVIVTNKDYNQADIQASIDSINQRLPDYAQITRWILARSPFSLENGQLTSNKRIRREMIWQAYQSDINALYVDKKHTKDTKHAVL